MKKVALFISFFMMITFAFSQMVIVSSDLINPGKINQVFYDTVSQPDLGTAGASPQTWDFSTLVNHYPKLAIYTPLTTNSSFYSQFPDANFYTYGPAWMYSGFFGGLPFDQSQWGYMFWKKDVSGWKVVGFHCNLGAGDTNIYESDQEMLMATPFAYGDSVTDTGKFEIMFNKNPADFDTLYISNVLKTLSCDAFGTITTPFVINQSVLRVHEYMIKYDSVRIIQSGIVMYSLELTRDTVNNYHFWTNNVGYPLAIVHANKNNVIKDIEYLTDTLKGYQLSGSVYESDGLNPITAGTAELFAADLISTLCYSPETIPLTADGKFQFATVAGGSFFVRAVPDYQTFPFNMPTYYGDSVNWQNADILSVIADTNISINTQSDSLYVPIPGNGTIMGNILQNLDGSKTIKPAANISIMLKNDASGKIIGHTLTDINGFYQFGNLPQLTYSIVVDIPALPMTSTYHIDYTSNDTLTNGLDFTYDSTTISPTQTTGIARYTFNNPEFKVFPNPCSDFVSIDLSGFESGIYQMEILNILGEKVIEKEISVYGKSLFYILLKNIVPGIYTMTMRNEKTFSCSALLKK